MQENNFEKQVHENLQGLRMHPSENVWLKVEASLKKKKDRRVLVLLLSLFFLAGAGLLTYNFYQPGNAQKIHELANETAPLEKSAPANSEIETVSDSNSKASATADTKPFSKQTSNGKKAASLLVLTPQNNQYVEDDQTSATRASNNKTLLYKTAKIRRYAGAKTAVQTDAVMIDTDEPGEAAPLLRRQPATFNLSGLMINDAKPGLHPTGNAINKNALALPGITIKELATTGKKAASQPGKISIALEAGIGRSGTANSYLGSIPNTRFYDYSLFNGSVGGSSQVADSLRPYNINPSALKPGAGFFAGVVFTKKVSANSSISAGLRYQLFTTSQSVGAGVATAYNNAQRQDGVFRAGITNSYTNVYQVLQLPVEFNTKLASYKQHDIVLSTGINLTQLLHTNALQFDNSTRQYYKNNQVLNKTIVGFSAGFSVDLTKGNKPALLLGPSFQYSFTPLANEGLYAKSHYSFLGLRLQKSLKKQ